MLKIFKRFRVVLLALVLVWVPSLPRAQGTISVAFPARVAAAPDYATEAFGDPWDMCNPQDISPNPDQRIGFSTFSFLTGPCRAGGTTAPVNGVADSSLMLVAPGIYGSALNPGRNGRSFPIDTTRYQTLSYKVSSSVADNPQIYWIHNPSGHPAGSGLGGRVLPPTQGGTQLTIADLTQAAIPGLSSWTSGNVRGGFRLDPNSSVPVGNVFYHWVRVTPSATSPLAARQSISWSGLGLATITVRDNSDGSIFPVASGQSSPYLWNYGVLPPGSYTLNVTNSSGSGSANFAINNPPRIEVTDPSPTTGQDYATTVLGNPWDMSDPADVQLTGSDYFTTPSFSGGVMVATNTLNDPNVTLLYNSNNGVPIDTSKYRYLTYRFQVDGPFDLGAGSVARIIWSSNALMSGFTATTTLDIIVWEGMNSYTIDLATLATGPDGGLEPNGQPEPWTAGPKRQLRFDPHEFPQARTFRIDDIKLTAKPAATSSYTIRFVGADPDGDAATVSLYYDTDTNPGNGKTHIASGIPQSAGQFVWNTALAPAGEYFIWAESSDGLQAVGRYSTVPIQLIPPAGTPTGFRIIQ